MPSSNDSNDIDLETLDTTQAVELVTDNRPLNRGEMDLQDHASSFSLLPLQHSPIYRCDNDSTEMLEQSFNLHKHDSQPSCDDDKTMIYTSQVDHPLVYHQRMNHNIVASNNNNNDNSNSTTNNNNNHSSSSSSDSSFIGKDNCLSTSGFPLTYLPQRYEKRQQPQHQQQNSNFYAKWPSIIIDFYHRLARHNHNDHAPRIIHINNPAANEPSQFLHNRVSTAKYNIITFLPKFLYVEFSKSANLFFLFISGIQQIPNISPTSRWTTLVPLVIVLMITAIKEILEDYGVHKSDHELNGRKCKTYNGQNQFVDNKWRDVKVGDICRVESGDFFPADLILISSSEPGGLCYIETSNLDGEVNLKIKQALPETATFISPKVLAGFSGVLKSEQPNNRLYNYDGTLTMPTDGDDGNNKDQNLPLDPSKMLLRGAQLRNTSWVYGLVVFTGHETKLMLNSSKKPTKASNVTHITNRNIMYLFIMLVIMSVLCSVGNLVIMNNLGSKLDYIEIPGTLNRAREFGFNILTFMILFNSFIPISLMVTMEIVKFVQSTMIDNDLDIYYDKTNTPALARSSSLIEELGQIEYVFSDKTGTLTCNEMEFRECSIAGLTYANHASPDRQPTAAADYSDSEAQYSFKQMEDHLAIAPQAPVIREFLTALMTCHTVIPELDASTGDTIYQASSPDEAALVKGASSIFGYHFYARRPHSIHCTIQSAENEYQILNVCEFNSTRKRMSVVLRDPQNRIVLYCKGADTMILERLDPDCPYVDATLTHLEDFASDGLRTLCYAMRKISEKEYAQWSQVYEKAATTLTNRAEALDDAAEMIEQNMTLVGATAIEDKLQEGVPDTIHTLQEAGIKVWVLTGDRQETAINIGHSCKLLTDDMDLLVCTADDFGGTEAILNQKLIELLAQKSDDHQEPLALVIDGKALTFALEKELEKTFYDIAVQCKAVICCRVSPLQKALVVKLVKKYTKSILLAIGDGANDVSMIQAAHVGVGISGMEGLQAARSADFAISQFRFLKKLLLVHGAWAYQRLSKMIFYYFYKNVTLYLTQFWYAIFNGFSGQTLYESWTMSCFNVFFTILPPLAIGIFDQFTSARLLAKYPQMYMLGQSNEFFNQKRFWGWILNAVYHSAVLFFLGMAAFRNDQVFMSGYSGGQWWVGTTIFSSTLATILWKGALITDIWTKWTWIAIPGSMAIWFIYLPLVSYVGPMLPFGIFSEYSGIVPALWGNFNYWLFFILVPLICVLRDYLWKYYKRIYRSRNYHYIQEIQKFNLPDYRPRMDRFQTAVNKVRRIQRLKQSRGFAFSQNEGDQGKIIRMYDTTRQKPSG